MRVQDTLSGSLAELPPAPESIGIYVCGPTVYQRAHIGNAAAEQLADEGELRRRADRQGTAKVDHI